MRLVGGSPALDLANTVVSRRDRHGPDMLNSFDDLVTWAVRAGLLKDADAHKLKKRCGLAVANKALERAKNLREAIYLIGSAIAGQSEIPTEALRELERAAKKARCAQRLMSGIKNLRWEVSDSTRLDVIADMVTDAAIELFTMQAGSGRLKECLGQNCGWLFLDTSRSGRRRWCSEKDCGSASRVRRHRARMKSST